MLIFTILSSFVKWTCYKISKDRRKCWAASNEGNCGQNNVTLHSIYCGKHAASQLQSCRPCENKMIVYLHINRGYEVTRRGLSHYHLNRNATNNCRNKSSFGFLCCSSELWDGQKAVMRQMLCPLTFIKMKIILLPKYIDNICSRNIRWFSRIVSVQFPPFL